MHFPMVEQTFIKIRELHNFEVLHFSKCPVLLKLTVLKLNSASFLNDEVMDIKIDYKKDKLGLSSAELRAQPAKVNQPEPQFVFIS